MARYRTKSPDDLLWNRIRRGLTRAFDTEWMNRREEALNTLLDGAFREFVAATQKGEQRELEQKYHTLITGIVDDELSKLEPTELTHADSKVE